MHKIGINELINNNAFNILSTYSVLGIVRGLYTHSILLLHIQSYEVYNSHEALFLFPERERKEVGERERESQVQWDKVTCVIPTQSGGELGLETTSILLQNCFS